MRKICLFLRKYCRREPLCSGVFLYVLLSFAPGLFGGGPLWLICVVRYILPGVLAWVIALICFDAPRPSGGFCGCVKSVLWSSPAALFCIINILVGTFSPGENVILPVFAAVSEELLCRLMLYCALRLYFQDQERGELSAVLVSSVLFGAAHLSNLGTAGIAVVLFQCCYTVVIGTIFANGYRRSRSVCGSILWHVLLNLTGTLFVWL